MVLFTLKPFYTHQKCYAGSIKMTSFKVKRVLDESRFDFLPQISKFKLESGLCDDECETFQSRFFHERRLCCSVWIILIFEVTFITQTLQNQDTLLKQFTRYKLDVTPQCSHVLFMCRLDVARFNPEMFFRRRTRWRWRFLFVHLTSGQSNIIIIFKWGTFSGYRL